jgi:hypothetical protein
MGANGEPDTHPMVRVHRDLSMGGQNGEYLAHTASAMRSWTCGLLKGRIGGVRGGR